MPMSARTSIRSCSVMFSMCRPLTRIAARVRSQQSENQLEHDRLPGAAGAEQDPHAALRDAEADIAQDDVIVEGEADLVEHDRRRHCKGA